MAKFKPIKLSESEVSQELNLKEIFGFNFKGKDALKQAIGQAFIDRIVERTKSGKRVDGKKLKSPYSKMYADSLDFKAAGKSRGKVNMTLTGDMLRSIDVLEVGANTLKIGVDDPDEAAKAYNHQVGDTVPARPFFGVTNKLVDEVKKEFRDDLRQAFSKRGENRDNALEAFILNLLKETDPNG